MIWITNLEFTSEAICPPRRATSGLSGGALRKIEYFPLRTKSCLSEASSFRLGKCDDFLALERQPAVFLFVIFFFLMAERKSKSIHKQKKRFFYLNK